MTNHILNAQQLKKCFNRHKLGHFSAQCFSGKPDTNRSKQVKAAGLCGDPASRDSRQDSVDSSDSDPKFHKCVSKKLGIQAVKGQNTSNILLPVYICEANIIGIQILELMSIYSLSDISGKFMKQTLRSRGKLRNQNRRSML